MPTISTFYGIVIRMYYRDHPPPHLHAIYGDQEAEIAIEDLRVLNGRLSRRALSLVIEWAEAHRSELLGNWALAQRHQPLKAVAPLD